MNQPKIFYMGKQINRTKRGRFTSIKTRIARAWYFLKVSAVIAAVLGGAFATGAAFFSTSTVVADTQTIQLPAPQSPVLERIADCESGNGTKGSATHYLNGQVLMKPNTNGTVDVGKYQINSVWFKQATTLGLDITKEADNKAMAEWIYANKGTGDWSASQKCWSNPNA